MPNAVITGATQGIGKAIAEKLLAEGCDVVVCARNTAKLNALKADWAVSYPERKVYTYDTDLSIKENIHSFSVYLHALMPHVDILVNNAGAFLPGEIADEPDGRLETLIATNLYSAYYLTRALLPAMKKSRSGHIFNLCSVASLRPYPNGGAYSISKYALLGFSENLREELKPWLIKVTAICPGATYTPSWEGSGVEEGRIMEAMDIAKMLWSACQLSPQANVETIVLRPVKGDL